MPIETTAQLPYPDRAYLERKEAETIAQAHADLALQVVRWFGFARRKEVTWGPDYNQVARDVYVEACRLGGVEPIPVGPGNQTRG